MRREPRLARGTSPGRLRGAVVRARRERHGELDHATGRSMIVENNYGYAPPPVAVENGKTTAPGVTSVDIRRSGRGCRTVWESREISPSDRPEALARDRADLPLHEAAGPARPLVPDGGRLLQRADRLAPPAGNGPALQRPLRRALAQPERSALLRRPGWDGGAGRRVDTMCDFLISRDDLRNCRTAESEPPELDPGQALLRVDCFGLTSNNVTYAVFGDAMSYWSFFPAEPGLGSHAGVGLRRGRALGGRRHRGRRARLRLPPGLQPSRGHAGTTRSDSFIDASPHRAELPPVYQLYTRTAGDDLYRPRPRTSRCCCVRSSPRPS